MTPYTPTQEAVAETDEGRKREELYDREIGPALRQLGQKCQDAGLSFVAIVEFEASSAGFATTRTLAREHSLSVILADMATRCHGNVDLLMKAICALAGKHGHSSVYLKLLGVPETPAKKGVPE